MIACYVGRTNLLERDWSTKGTLQSVPNFNNLHAVNSKLRKIVVLFDVFRIDSQNIEDSPNKVLSQVMQIINCGVLDGCNMFLAYTMKFIFNDTPPPSWQFPGWILKISNRMELCTQNVEFTDGTTTRPQTAKVPSSRRTVSFIFKIPHIPRGTCNFFWFGNHPGCSLPFLSRRSTTHSNQ